MLSENAPAAAPVTAAAPAISADRIDLSYNGPLIVEDLSVSIPTKGIVSIVGTNACGKTTLIKALARLLAPDDGRVLLDGRDIHNLPTKAVATRLGILPQSPRAPDGVTVSDLVRRGRFPHQNFFNQWSDSDERAVAKALGLMRLEELGDIPVDELSGGQRQRAWIAMVIAQDTPLIFLDEPCTHLDIAHQMELLDMLDDLTKKESRAIVMVLHDLNQASQYADHIIAMQAGRIAAEGAPHEIITSDFVEKVFGVCCHVIENPVSGTPLCIPAHLALGKGYSSPSRNNPESEYNVNHC